MELPTDRPLRVLFVCTGNICRSPTAEGVARRMFAEAGLGERVEFESAGTHGYHVGEAPDPRTCKVAARRGYDLSSQRARKLDDADFSRFDLLLAMDQSHFEQMQRRCPPSLRQRIALFTSHAAGGAPRDVPDPYYGGPDGFDEVIDLCEAGVRGLLECLETQSQGGAPLR